MVNRTDSQLGIIGFDEIPVERKEYFFNYNFDDYNTDLVKRVNIIPGFFFIITRELLIKVGQFDEEYFMYGEDNDYFKRAQKAGFSIYNTYLPIMHYSEGSSSNSKQTSWYVYRNAFLFAQKNLTITATLKLLLSFINIIYNPFYKTDDPSRLRVKRNGFFYNNYPLN